jgi:hypothetical protein
MTGALMIEAGRVKFCCCTFLIFNRTQNLHRIWFVDDHAMSVSARRAMRAEFAGMIGT